MCESEILLRADSGWEKVLNGICTVCESSRFDYSYYLVLLGIPPSPRSPEIIELQPIFYRILDSKGFNCKIFKTKELVVTQTSISLRINDLQLAKPGKI